MSQIEARPKGANLSAITPWVDWNVYYTYHIYQTKDNHSPDFAAIRILTDQGASWGILTVHSQL